MKHIILFENWEESKQLNDFNNITGVFDGEDICHVESGEDYGIEDDIVSKYHFVYQGKKLYIKRVDGRIDDDFLDITVYLTDGEFYDIRGYWNLRHGEPSNEDYFRVSSPSRNKTERIEVDPQWVMEDFLHTMGMGSQILFVTLFYPGCEVYYNDKLEEMPEIKLAKNTHNHSERRI